MSIFKDGPLGNSRGKIGNVVISKFRNLVVGRSTPSKSSKPPTLKQLVQQARFKLVSEFFNRISEIISVGYQSASGKLSAVNTAVKTHMDKIILGAYPNFTLDYTKIAISAPYSKAEIYSGFSTKAVAVPGYRVDITWSVLDSSGDTKSLPTDRLYALFYCVEQKRFMTFSGIADRSALTVNVRLPLLMFGTTIHLYTFFASADGSLTSYSEYLGIVKLIA